MQVCVVTCTGGRPELFALCRKWVERQTKKVDQWLVATDNGDTPEIPTWAKHEHLPAGGPDSALITMLGRVPDDHAVIVMEDDDWYSPVHVETIVKQIDAGHMLSCQRQAMRFHLPAMRCTELHEQQGFIQGTVGIHPNYVEAYRKMIERGDLSAPEHESGRYDEITTIGIKGAGHGLPGRAGFTRSHLPHHRKTTSMLLDPDHRTFRRWLGADADDYLRLLLT